MNKKEIAQYLQDELESVYLTRNFVNARVVNFIGTENICLTVAKGKTKETWPNGIIENDHSFMKFLILFSSEGHFYIKKPFTHSRVLENNGIKFRVIKANTELNAVEKLVNWFQLNQNLF